MTRKTWHEYVWWLKWSLQCWLSWRALHLLSKNSVKNTPGHQYFITNNKYFIIVISYQQQTEYLQKIQSWSLSKKNKHTQKLAISKKSKTFVQFSWNLVKMITSWGNYFYQVSWGLDTNCGIFANGRDFSVSSFSYSDLIWQDLEITRFFLCIHAVFVVLNFTEDV